MRIYKYSQAAIILLAVVLLSLGASAQTCPGHRDSFANTRIVGGTQARLAYWPALAALRLKEPGSSRAHYFCGGAAIATEWILTAAHCTGSISRAQDGTYVDTSGWQVQAVLGTDNLEVVSTLHLHAVDNVIVRDGYTDPIESGNDVALLHIATPWKGPVARLALAANADPVDGMSFAAGFGKLKSDQQIIWKKLQNGDMISAASTRLQEVVLPIVNTEACRAIYQGKPAYKDAKIGPGQVCAGYDRGRKDTCQGDSGGPLVFYDRNNCPSQIGVVSWGADCAEPNAYGIYARVSAHRDWILKHVPDVTEAPVAVATRNATVSIADAHLATAMQQLENELAGAKGRVRIAVSAGSQVSLGGLFSLKVDSEVAGRLILLDVNANGELMQIFPNQYVTTGDAKFIDKSKPVLIPDAGNPAYRGLKGFRAAEPIGPGRLVAIVAPKDVSVAEIVEAPKRTTRGLMPEGEPTSYVLNLFDQLIAAASTRANRDGWALGDANYEIVR